MNELKKNENENFYLNSNIMVSSFVRKSLREHFNLSNDEINTHAQEGGMGVDDYYLYLKGLRDEERKAVQRKKNTMRNVLYRIRQKIKAYTNLITDKLEDLISKDIDEVVISLNKLDNDVGRILEILSTSTNLIIRAGGNTWTLNSRTKGSLLAMIHGAVFTEHQGTDSDAELYEVIKNFDTLKVSRVRPITKVNTKKNTQPAAEWFRYYHNIEGFDFTRLQIFTDHQSSQYDDNCFVYALRMFGLEELELNTIKNKITMRCFPQKEINPLALALGLYIEVVRPDSKNITSYGIPALKNTTRHIKLGLIDEHYFLHEPLQQEITAYAIKTYDKENKDPLWFKRRSKTHFGKGLSNTYKLMMTLIKYKDKALTLIPRVDLLNTQFYDKNSNIDSLEYIPEMCLTSGVERIEKYMAGVERSKKQLPNLNIFFDFETNTKYRNEEDKIIHKAYMVCWLAETDDKKVFNPDDVGHAVGWSCAKEMFKVCATKYGQDYSMTFIAHNCGYDYRFCREFSYHNKFISQGHSLICGSGTIYDVQDRPVKINYKDSYKMISTALRNFFKMFHLEVFKEYIPYALYTTENIEKVFVDIGEVDSYFDTAENAETFYNNCVKWKCFNRKETKIDIIKYSLKYCELDCLVLQKGYSSFRNSVKEISKTCNKLGDRRKLKPLNIDNFFTISSVALKIHELDGCFEDCYKLSGIPREFHQKCVVGGRTMTRENKKVIASARKITDPKHRHFGKTQYIDDFDSVSNYTSAMTRIEGFIKGAPIVIPPLKYEDTKGLISELDKISNNSHYFLQVKILKVGTHRQFPCISIHNQNSGVRNFVDFVEGEEIYCDKTMIMDWIEFHKVEVELIRGYYYNQGYNKQVNITQETLFKKRLEEKKKGNPIQEVYKLILNSSYGKTLENAHEDTTKFIAVKDRDKFISRNYNFIKCIKEVDGKVLEVKQYKPIDDHFNDVQQGVYILGMSKRIMNEVMCLAEDKGLDCYYTDTDSIHMNSLDVPLLADAFEEKYNRVLIGKGLGQFHSDFDMAGCKDVKSLKFVALGKKCYQDSLEGINIKTGKKESGSHIRMKGVPNRSINCLARQGKESVEELYDFLAEGSIGKSIHRKYNEETKKMMVETVVEDKKFGSNGEKLLPSFLGNKAVFNICRNEDGSDRLVFKFLDDWTITNYNDHTTKKGNTGFERCLGFNNPHLLVF